ncbi:hypothetical protein F7725_020055 [Dissostichus mawsoni]|uniref:Cell cycle control protein n=1 Tax=Dissostichus mawsoni TaxID=36200 RepID=A0A7J5YLG4_DISMA|nr:hypothetical protein F7725_020055 [Dissostichus mawsoni]
MMASSYTAKEEDGHITVSGPGALRSRKPENTAFKQQRLPAWQPILTAGTVLPAFFIIGLLFIPIGIGLFIDYTGVDASSPCFNCSQSFSWNSSRPFVFDPQSNVYVYYGLSNFYQNHRRYVKSRDDSQLNGDPKSLMVRRNTLELFYNDPNGTKVQILLNTTGIAWWTDKHPINWRRPVFDLDADEGNNGFINEDFIVWMRTAALPTFRKLYRIINKKSGMVPTLPRGNYSLEVVYNYPVRSFEGRKRMILSTISWMGGKNPFLGIAYITVGSVCFFLGVVLLLIHHKCGNRNNNADISN